MFGRPNTSAGPHSLDIQRVRRLALFGRPNTNIPTACPDRGSFAGRGVLPGAAGASPVRAVSAESGANLRLGWHGVFGRPNTSAHRASPAVATTATLSRRPGAGHQGQEVGLNGDERRACSDVRTTGRQEAGGLEPALSAGRPPPAQCLPQSESSLSHPGLNPFQLATSATVSSAPAFVKPGAGPVASPASGDRYYASGDRRCSDGRTPRPALLPRICHAVGDRCCSDGRTQTTPLPAGIVIHWSAPASLGRASSPSERSTV